MRSLPFAASAVTNENKSQAKSALVGLLYYMLVKYKPDKTPYPGESQRYPGESRRCLQAEWKTEYLHHPVWHTQVE